MANNQVALKNKRILLMGAGGAARGVLSPLLAQQPLALVIVNRTASKAIELASEFSDLGNVSGCGYEKLIDETAFDVIINATAASLQGELPPLPDHIVAENVGNTTAWGVSTTFMQWARENDAAKILDGLGMLVEQAAESFNIWRGVQPNTHVVIELLRKELQA